MQEDRFAGRVLVVEDCPTNQLLISLLLERLGLEVTLAGDGKEAVDIALSQAFDLIFMDMQMPNMNGYDATKALRKNSLTIPIVALTAYAMKGDREKCIFAGCDDYLAKPIKREKLIQIIRKYLPSKSEPEFEAGRLSRFFSGEKSTGEPKYESANVQGREAIISWSVIMEACGTEDMVEEIVGMFLKDAPRCMELAGEAVESKNLKDLKLYAHRLKGSAGYVGAVQLSEVCRRLECAADEKDIEAAALLFSDVKEAFEKVMSFLSRDNWIELAKQQGNSKQAERAAIK